MKNDDDLYFDTIIAEGRLNIISPFPHRYLVFGRLGFDTNNRTYTILSEGFIERYLGTAKDIVDESMENFRDFKAKRGFAGNPPESEFKISQIDWLKQSARTRSK